MGSADFKQHVRSFQEWADQPATSLAWPLVYEAHSDPELLPGFNALRGPKGKKKRLPRGKRVHEYSYVAPCRRYRARILLCASLRTARVHAL